MPLKKNWYHKALEKHCFHWCTEHLLDFQFTLAIKWKICEDFDYALYVSLEAIYFVYLFILIPTKRVNIFEHNIVLNWTMQITTSINAMARFNFPQHFFVCHAHAFQLSMTRCQNEVQKRIKKSWNSNSITNIRFSVIWPGIRFCDLMTAKIGIYDSVFCSIHFARYFKPNIFMDLLSGTYYFNSNFISLWFTNETERNFYLRASQSRFISLVFFVESNERLKRERASERRENEANR